MWLLLRKFLFLFPAEFTHELAKLFMKSYFHLSPCKKIYRTTTKNYLDCLNPIGLAAGFDKNAEILAVLPHFGFGYAEIGTVTPRPQGGNERPRLFRDPKNRNVFNRMGFNNLGAGVVSERVRKVKPSLPLDFKVGVNLGKNKTTSDAEAHLDYAKVASAFLDCADYFVINVSSPNTPGLRALQTPEFLLPIVRAVQDEVAKSAKKIPILVKLAPEMDGAALKSVVEALESIKIDGLVLTNTLAGTYIYRQKEYTGGFSGQILSSVSLLRLQEVRKMTSLPILSVGGISSIDEMKRRFAAGANGVQIYSAWVFNGPFWVRRLAEAVISRG